MFKKIKIAIIVLLCITFSCSENILTSENDVKKYPWLKKFILEEIEDFYGTHNYDNGVLIFSYTYNEPNDSVLLFMDSIAKIEKWDFIEVKEFFRTYSKVLYQFPLDTTNTYIEIKIDTSVRKIHYIIE
jgi:hypothetical protein